MKRNLKGCLRKGFFFLVGKRHRQWGGYGQREVPGKEHRWDVIFLTEGKQF